MRWSDALDEVPDGQKDALVEAIRKWSKRLSGSVGPRIYLTSRIVGYDPARHNPFVRRTECELELLPFDRPQVDQFARAYFTTDQSVTEKLPGQLTSHVTLSGWLAFRCC